MRLGVGATRPVVRKVFASVCKLAPRRLAEPTVFKFLKSVTERQHKHAYIYVLLHLPWLAPDITTAIVNGRQPPQLTAKKLMRLTPRLPVDWAAQRTLLGFR
jgi:hypothetical protein